MLSNEALEDGMQNYMEALSEFECNTQLKCFAKYFTTMTFPIPENVEDVSVRLNKCCMQCRLKDLDGIAENITDKFSLQRFLLLLKEVNVNKSTVTWAIPLTICGRVRH